MKDEELIAKTREVAEAFDAADAYKTVQMKVPTNERDWFVLAMTSVLVATEKNGWLTPMRVGAIVAATSELYAQFRSQTGSIDLEKMGTDARLRQLAGEAGVQ